MADINESYYRRYLDDPLAVGGLSVEASNEQVVKPPVRDVFKEIRELMKKREN